MNQPATRVGIDVRNATLAVCYQVADKPQHLEVSNSKVESRLPTAYSSLWRGLLLRDGGYGRLLPIPGL
jgi:hypothetical protein